MLLDHEKIPQFDFHVKVIVEKGLRFLLALPFSLQNTIYFYSDFGLRMFGWDACCLFVGDSWFFIRFGFLDYW